MEDLLGFTCNTPVHNTIRDQWRLLETSGDYRRPVETTGDQWSPQRPVETIRDYRDYWRPAKTVETRGDYWRPPETSVDYKRLETTGDQ